jgi:hypothetical protein
MGLSAMELGRLAKVAGSPVRPGKRGAEFAFPDMILWWADLKAKKAAERAAPGDIGDAELRRAAAEAELAEHKVLQARGQLMTLETHEAAVRTMLARLNARLGALPARAAQSAMTAYPEGQAAVRVAMEDVTEELKAELRQPIQEGAE